MNRLPTCLHLFLFIMMSFSLPDALARDYRIDEIFIQADIRPDATVRYIEERTYHFDGQYRFAYYTLPLDGFDSVENISVRQDGRLLTSSNSEDPGTFKVERNQHEVRITWFFETEGAREHTFAIQYDLMGALVTGPEITEWFWFFLSDRLDRPPRQFRSRITLPSRISEDDWHVWLRETPDNVSMRIDGRTLFLEGEGFRSQDVILARIVFPSRVLTDAGVTDRYLGLDRVQQEESVWLDARKRDQQLHMLGIGFLAILAPGSIFLFIWFYRRYGRRYNPETGSFDRFLYTPPSDHPPALVRKLMLGPLSADPDPLCLGITLFDLARNGYYRIVEKKGEKKFLSSQMPLYHLEKTGKKPDITLHEWERALLEKVNGRIDDGETRMDNIMDWSDKATKAWWKNWRKLFKNDLKKTGWFDQTANKALYLHLLAQVPILFGMIVVTILAGPVGLAGIAVAFFMMFLSLTLPRRSQEAVNLHERWNSYRKALKKGSDPSFDQKDISRNFVYAIALGLSRKQFEKFLSNVGEESSLFLWIVPTAGALNTAGIASGLSTLASSGTSSFGGVSGGSGASAGSAGGGSGGGAG